MESSATWTVGVFAAMAAGAAGSLHCLAMCGLWACAPLANATKQRWQVAGSWQLGRLVGYAAVGAAWGTLGAGIAALLPSLRTAFPWLMVLGLLLTAVDLSQWFKPFPVLSKLTRYITQRAAAWVPPVRALVMGAMTPLLPCGLLYGMALSAGAAGTAHGGAAVMAAFALGSMPALVLAQSQQRWLHAFPRFRRYGRPVLFVATALVLAFRIYAQQATPEAPHCH